ncbi:MAG: hypothetical protein GY827_04040 [Cytophagales bacterium]|nr:hypothetical protein [Cytophagales bacterium]
MKKVILGLGIASILFACNPSAQEGNNTLSSATLIEKATITPPLANVKVPFQTYTINPQESRTIELSNGTRINIPASAFVDANGNEVTEPVDICYREFHTPAEVLASGIPMTYDSAGVHSSFATSGMFEIRALDKKNKELKLNQGKAIDVKLASFTNGEGYNVYHFAEKEEKKVEQAGFLPILQLSPQMTVTRETVLEMDERQGAWIYKGAPQVADNPVKQELVDSLENAGELIKPVEPLQFDKDAYTFDLDFDVKEFEELEGFENVFWQYVGTDEATNPANSRLMSDVEEWNDIKIEASTEKSGVYIMTLQGTYKGRTRIFKTEVSPMLKGKNLAKAQEKFLKKMEKFEKKFEKRKRTEQRKVLIADYLRDVNVTTMGVWNTDKPISRKEYKLMVEKNKETISEVQNSLIVAQATFMLDGKEVTPKTAHVISSLDFGNVWQGRDNTYTMTNTFYPEELKETFFISPVAKNRIMITLEDGRIAYVDKNVVASLDFEKISTDKKLTLPTVIAGEKYKTVSSVQKLIDSL